jgi:hypothetical protein
MKPPTIVCPMRVRDVEIRHVRKMPKNWPQRQGLWDPATGTITIKDNLRGSDHLTVVIHELMHEAFRDLDEDSVEEGAMCIAEALWALGYRRVPDAEV